MSFIPPTPEQIQGIYSSQWFKDALEGICKRFQDVAVSEKFLKNTKKVTKGRTAPDKEMGFALQRLVWSSFFHEEAKRHNPTRMYDTIPTETKENELLYRVFTLMIRLTDPDNEFEETTCKEAVAKHEESFQNLYEKLGECLAITIDITAPQDNHQANDSEKPTGDCEGYDERDIDDVLDEVLDGI